MKKAFITIAIIVIIFAAIRKLNLSTQSKKNNKMFTPEDAKKAIQDVSKKYGPIMAQTVEKIMRLETAHFTSDQFRQTGSAGMEKGKWFNLPPNLSTIKFKDNTDKHIGDFIVWPSVTDFAFYLADYINRKKGNFANWNSTDPTRQDAYRSHVNSITTHFA